KPEDRDWQRADLWLKLMAKRPDHSKATLPGYRRVGPKEIPPKILDSARGIAAEIGKEPEIVPGFKRTEYGPDGRVFVSLVEKHAEGKIGVSVFVKEGATDERRPEASTTKSARSRRSRHVAGRRAALCRRDGYFEPSTSSRICRS